MSVFELPTVTLIPNGIHHPPIEDGRLLPNSVKKWVIFWREILLARARLFYLFFKDFLEPFLGGS
ncbi:hypothetical protein CYQ65_12720 [Enterococcus faecium]|nr:hypothetical protein CYQ65_12720 [Enterococcus faecium]